MDNAVGEKDGSELGLDDEDGTMVPTNDGDLDSDGSSETVSVGFNDELGYNEGSSDEGIDDGAALGTFGAIVS